MSSVVTGQQNPRKVHIFGVPAFSTTIFVGIQSDTQIGEFVKLTHDKYQI